MSTTSPEDDYPYIRLYGQLFNASDDHVAGLLRLARDTGAPPTAIRLDDNHEWLTIEDLKSPDLREFMGLEPLPVKFPSRRAAYWQERAQLLDRLATLDALLTGPAPLPREVNGDPAWAAVLVPDDADVPHSWTGRVICRRTRPPIPHRPFVVYRITCRLGRPPIAEEVRGNLSWERALEVFRGDTTNAYQLLNSLRLVRHYYCDTGINCGMFWARLEGYLTSEQLELLR